MQYFYLNWLFLCFSLTQNHFVSKTSLECYCYLSVGLVWRSFTNNEYFLTFVNSIDKHFEAHPRTFRRFKLCRKPITFLKQRGYRLWLQWQGMHTTSILPFTGIETRISRWLHSQWFVYNVVQFITRLVNVVSSCQHFNFNLCTSNITFPFNRYRIVDRNHIVARKVSIWRWYSGSYSDYIEYLR